MCFYITFLLLEKSKFGKIVYSKSGHPVSNVTVTLYVYTSGMDEALPNPYHVTTDVKGHFMFSEIAAKNRSFGLDVTNGFTGNY